MGNYQLLFLVIGIVALIYSFFGVRLATKQLIFEYRIWLSNKKTRAQQSRYQQQEDERVAFQGDLLLAKHNWQAKTVRNGQLVPEEESIDFWYFFVAYYGFEVMNHPSVRGLSSQHPAANDRVFYRIGGGVIFRG